MKIQKEKPDLDANPSGTASKVALQREREKRGRFVAVPGDKIHTRIFVRNGQDPASCIDKFLKRYASRSKTKEL